MQFDFAFGKADDLRPKVLGGVLADYSESLVAGFAFENQGLALAFIGHGSSPRLDKCPHLRPTRPRIQVWRRPQRDGLQGVRAARQSP